MHFYPNAYLKTKNSLIIYCMINNHVLTEEMFNSQFISTGEESEYLSTCSFATGIFLYLFPYLVAWIFIFLLLYKYMPQAIKCVLHYIYKLQVIHTKDEYFQAECVLWGLRAF